MAGMNQPVHHLSDAKGMAEVVKRIIAVIFLYG